jgi:hypothetical protein
MATPAKPTTKEEPKPAPYPKNFDFATGDEKLGTAKIKMTFGLLTTLSKDFQSMDDFQMAITNQDVLMDLVNTCIAKRTPEGDVDQEHVLDVREMDPEVAEYGRITEWIMGHVLSFFATRTKAFVEATASSQSQLGEMAVRLAKLKIGSAP